MGYIILNKVIGGIKVLHGTSPYIRTTKAEQKTALRGIDTLSLTVESAIQIDFELGDSITVFGKSYSINKPQAVVHSIEGLKHTYEVTLEGAQYKLINAVLFDMGISGKATSTNVDYYANLLEMLRLIVTCANFNEGSTVWILDETSVPVTDRKDFSFTDTNCLDVIQTVCSEDNFDIDFKIIELNGTYTISVGNIGNVLSYEFEIGETKGLYKLEQNPNSENDTVFTRLYYFGSSDNLASDYRNYSKKLLLPTSVPSGVVLPSNIELVNDTLSGLVYLQLKGLTSHISKVITNDDIKPHRTGTVTSIESGNVLVFYDTSMDFDINEKDSFGNSKYLLSGTAAKIHFNTGKLSGNEFTATYRDSDKRFTLASYTDDNGQVYPDSSSTAFQFSVGDEYVILDIVMPNTYVDLAEKNLLVKGIDEITSGCNATFKYTLSIYELFLRKLNTYGTVSNFFNAGDSVKVVNSSMGLNEYIRIQSVTRDWIKPFNYTLELSESQSVSFKQEIVKALTTVNSVIVKNDLSNTAKSKRNWRTTEELLMLPISP